MFKLILILLLAFVCFVQAGPFCYYCMTHKEGGGADEECEVNPPPEKYIIDCIDGPYKRTNISRTAPDQDQLYLICTKVTGTGPQGEDVVLRGCDSGSQDDDGVCETLEDGEYEDIGYMKGGKICMCIDDRCNGQKDITESPDKTTTRTTTEAITESTYRTSEHSFTGSTTTTTGTTEKPGSGPINMTDIFVTILILSIGKLLA